MNLSSLLLATFFAIVCKLVSASSNEIDEKTKILKAIIHYLPEACKRLNTIGSFNAQSEESYKCLFDDNFNVQKTSIVMNLLMQRGDLKFVQYISKKWISERKWGSFTQEQIVSDLIAIISVKSHVRYNEEVEKQKLEIEPKSIYDTLKVLLEEGSEYIVANEIFSKVAAKVLKLAHRVDKNENDFMTTCSIILDHFYSIKDTDTKSSDKKIDYEKLANAYYAVQSLNRLVKKDKIDKEVWNIYAPIFCLKLKSIYGVEFNMSDKVSKKKNLNNGEIEGESNVQELKGSNSSDDEKDMKYIELMSKEVFEIKPKSIIITKPSSNNYIEFNSTGFWGIIGGSILLLSLLGYVIYNFKSKNRKSSEQSAL